jgi:hypothetical protein
LRRYTLALYYYTHCRPAGESVADEEHHTLWQEVPRKCTKLSQ